MVKPEPENDRLRVTGSKTEGQGRVNSYSEKISRLAERLQLGAKINSLHFQGLHV